MGGWSERTVGVYRSWLDKLRAHVGEDPAAGRGLTRSHAAHGLHGLSRRALLARKVGPHLLDNLRVGRRSRCCLGVGVNPPTPSWGSMVSDGGAYPNSAPWLASAPALTIMITVIAVNLLGDGLRDALDPALRGSIS